MILGIDYGRAKIGLAYATSSLAAPLKVVQVSSWEDALDKVAQVVKLEEAEKVVVGISENEMGEEQQRFASELQALINRPVETWDEGLSTQDAQQAAIEAGIPREKRKNLEDAFAAALVLQSYLDSQ